MSEWKPKFGVGDRFSLGRGMTETVIEITDVGSEDGTYSVAIGRRDTMTEEFLARSCRRTR